MALCWTLDKLGPMCRTAWDCNTVLQVIMGEDERDPTTIGVYRSGRARWIASQVHASEAGRRKAKIATVKGTYEDVQPAVRENFWKAIEVLRGQGHTVSEIEYPDFPYGPIVGTIVDAEGASAFEDILRDGRAKTLRAVADKIGGFAAGATLAIDYLRAMRVRTKVRRAIVELFDQVDLIAAPTRSTVAYPIGPNFQDVYKEYRSGPGLIPSMNLVGAPGISMPNGFGENNLPTAIQLNAAPANETLLMNVAINYQLATEHHKKRPNGFTG
jgi:aspartyl-tRNA(Asn)/glutamyl-tRNA(Gln) amidotransferase subunit A